MVAKIGFDTAENEPSKVCPIDRNAFFASHAVRNPFAQRRARGDRQSVLERGDFGLQGLHRRFSGSLSGLTRTMAEKHYFIAREMFVLQLS